MVAIYVLKLVRGKYYVGLTTKNIDRVHTHIGGKGAKWTKKYPPSSAKPILSFQEGLRKSDENRITLETMARFGVKNVRGGDWCKVKMTSREISELEQIVKSKTKKSGIKRSPKGNATRRGRTSKTYQCGRCGREGHNRTQCYASSTVDGVTITTESWLYRPLKSSKKAKSKRKRCAARTDLGLGSRCSLTASSGSKYCHVHNRNRYR